MLLGVCTVADQEMMREGSSWFGHPPFELPRREVVAMDRSLTHEPSSLRYLNRVLWEAARATLPIVPTLAMILWLRAVASAEAAVSTVMLLFVMLPAINLAWMMAFALLILAMKWVLLGRVKPGQHALWSCWCSRWDFLYVAWGIYARAGLSALEGTLMLTAYLRVVGMRIGRGVVLGGGFAQVVDPDMLILDDGATVSALFQAHTFEDRVLKIDTVHIRRDASVGSGTVVLYGADIGERASVASQSVVMKRERLLPARQYAGCPTQAVHDTPNRN
jgi:non-ribosomal peptide synthetase-like protein